MNSSLLSAEEQLALAEVSKDAPARLAVLVVEDEPDLRATLAEIFQAHGIKCFTAAGVEPALAELKVQPSIGLLLTDLKMSGGGGLELIRRVRQSERAGLPVMVMSGRAELDDAIEAVHLRVLEFLVKPMDMNYLVGLVRRELGLDNAQPNGVLH
jgi:DNA-binding NtrC family response regulator